MGKITFTEVGGKNAIEIEFDYSTNVGTVKVIGPGIDDASTRTFTGSRLRLLVATLTQSMIFSNDSALAAWSDTVMMIC